MKFTLDAAALERIFRAWNVRLPASKDSGKILFALRGSLPTAPLKGWATSAILETVELDYIHLRCTLGVWDRKTGKIFLGAGSTVPHRDNVAKAAARRGVMQGRGTNQVEPGFYTDLQKGEHLQGKPQGHAALRQTGFRFYRRARHAPPYTKKDPLFFGNPYDNLHCAWNPDPDQPGFRSAGCLVVAGWPHSPRLPDAKPNRGAWKIFHDLIYAVPQSRFPLLLLPAAEAAAALTPREKTGGENAARLCYGSEGPEVEALQRALRKTAHYKGRITGKLGVSTYRAWNRAGFKRFS